MPKKILTTLTLLILFSLIIAACATLPQDASTADPTDSPPTADSGTKTVLVGPILVDCVGANPQQCMLVKEDPQEPYTYFYDQIEGFEFEPGYQYELLVLSEDVEDPPADASSIQWSLVEELNKTPAASPLDGTLWSLASHTNTEGESLDTLTGSEITAAFAAVELNGSAGCNNYFGSYTIDGERIYTGMLANTEMYCMEPEGVMEQESEYLATLRRADTYYVEEDQLYFFDADGNILLSYQLVVPAALTGTNWSLTGYNNGTGGFVSLLEGTSISALFAGDGSLNGSAGCNSYMSSYEVDGENITVGFAASTQMFCAEPEGIMEQENAYLAALGTVATYQIQGDELIIFNADGGRALSYVVLPITYEELGNAEYRSVWTEDGIVQLEDGEYREQAAPDSASELLVLLFEYHAFGELEDGAPAAAVVLVTSGGGSGSFYDLALVTKEGDELVNVAVTSLGDRVGINSLSFEDEKIVVDMVTHGPDDPLCCPTQHVIQTYMYNGSELLLESSKSVSESEFDPLLLDVVWLWEGSQYNNDTSAVPDNPEVYFVEFMADGQVLIKADCNTVQGTYSTAAGSSINFDEPLVTTLAACPPGSLADDFLRDLVAATIYFFEDDFLYMDMKYDTGTMKFSRSE